MTRLYGNASFARRLNIYVVVLVIVMLNGVWELWSALRAAPPDTTGLAFGAMFLLGGAYGLYQTFVDGRDLVAAFDDLGDGNVAVTLWRPFRRLQLSAPVASVTGWRFWIKSGSGQRNFFFYATFPGYPRALQFELRRGEKISDGLRRIAPQAVDDFEQATGSETPPGSAA